MRILMMAVCVFAALLMIAVSTSMNFLFMQSLAQTDAEGYALGGASAASDIIKSCLPWFISLAVVAGRWVFAAVGSVVFVAFSLFSFASALGFAADVRGAMAGSREAASAELARLVRDEAALRDAATALGTQRPTSVIAADLAVMRQDKRFQTSAECANATVAASRSYCQRYFALTGEEAAALEGIRLGREIQAIEKQMTELRARGAGSESDPQVAILARLLHQERDAVKTSLVVGAALLVELGSGFGLWLALGHSDRPSRRRQEGADVSALHATAALVLTEPAVPALPAPASRAEAVACDVKQFCVERLVPTDHGGLTFLALYRDYQNWARLRDTEAVDRAEFESDFLDIARLLQLERDGARFIGIATGRPHEI